MTFDEAEFVSLLSRLVAEAEHVQNSPPGLIPSESRVAAHVLAELAPHATDRGGPLEVREVAFAPGRANVLVPMYETDRPRPPVEARELTAHAA